MSREMTAWVNNLTGKKNRARNSSVTPADCQGAKPSGMVLPQGRCGHNQSNPTNTPKAPTNTSLATTSARYSCPNTLSRPQGETLPAAQRRRATSVKDALQLTHVARRR